MPILQADGTAYKAPLLLNAEEMFVMERIFGLNKRAGAPSRNRWSVGVVPAKHPRAVLLKEMSEKGLVWLELNLSKAPRAAKMSRDLSKAELVAHSTHFGSASMVHTIKEAAHAQALVKKAEAVK